MHGRAPASEPASGIDPRPPILLRKIWLPKIVYDSLPAFYLVSGVAALFATLYINTWLWVVPHYVLFSAACLHISLMLLRRRRHAAELAGPEED